MTTIDKKKLVYIAHPIGGDVKHNIESILRILQEIHTGEEGAKGIIPFAPYLIALNYLNDENPKERSLGMEANKVLFERRVMDELWLCGPKISSGMQNEIYLSLDNQIPITCYNPALKFRCNSLIETYSKINKLVTQ